MNRRTFFREWGIRAPVAAALVLMGCGSDHTKEISVLPPPVSPSSAAPSGDLAFTVNPTSIGLTDRLWGDGTGAARDLKPNVPGMMSLVLIPHDTNGPSNAELTLMNSDRSGDSALLTISARNSGYIFQQITENDISKVPIVFVADGGTPLLTLHPNRDVEVHGTMVVNGKRYS